MAKTVEMLGLVRIDTHEDSDLTEIYLGSVCLIVSHKDRQGVLEKARRIAAEIDTYVAMMVAGAQLDLLQEVARVSVEKITEQAKERQVQ